MIIIKSVQYHLIFFIWFTYTVPATSQDVNMYALGTKSNDTGSLFITESGIFLLGYSEINGNEDIYIAKLNNNFGLIWSKLLDASNAEKGYELIEASNGNLIISGTGNSNSSTIILNFTPSGELLNATGVGFFHDRLRKIISTSDSGYLCYGELEGLVPGHNEVSLIKYNKNGNIEWKIYYESSGSNDSHPDFELYARQAIQLNDSSFIILASYTDLRNPFTKRLIRLIKANKNGQEEWVYGYHGGKMDNAHHFIQCEDGGYLISATSNSYSPMDTDILLIKIDSDGKPEWSKTYGGDNDEAAGAILQLTNGNYMISGSTKSFGAGNYDFLLFEIDKNGNLVKAHSYGGFGIDMVQRLDTLHGAFILSGTTTSFVQGETDILIVETKFENASSECSADITPFLESNSVNTNFTSDQYSSGSFVSPTKISLGISEVNSTMLKVCYFCPEGSIKKKKLCPDDSIVFDYSHDDIKMVRWNDGFDDLVRTIRDEGNYWVDVFTNECVYRDTIIIIKETIYKPDLGDDRTICKKDTVILDAYIPNGLSYKWGDGTTNPIYFATQPGSYKVNVSTTCGLVSDSVILSYPDLKNLFIPNVITPNDDGINDFFEIYGTDSNIDLLIVNRWGKEVFKSKSYNQKWNGGNLPSGTYYYHIQIGCAEQSFKGWIDILK